tara:strand:+ start:1152 stop:1484 length:333 start_codon:yes stop_codon:yes gene_type:complete
VPHHRFAGFAAGTEVKRSVEPPNDTGVLAAKINGHVDGVVFFIVRLTNEGYHSLDTVRDATIWMKTKKQLAKVGGSSAARNVTEVVAVGIATKPGVFIAHRWIRRRSAYA